MEASPAPIMTHNDSFRIWVWGVSQSKGADDRREECPERGRGGKGGPNA